MSGADGSIKSAVAVPTAACSNVAPIPRKGEKLFLQYTGQAARYRIRESFDYLLAGGHSAV